MADDPEAISQYFDRLDAAFAKLNASPRQEPQATGPAPGTPAPTARPPVATQPPSPTAGAASMPATPFIAEAFAALLALEDGEPGAKPVRLTTTLDQPPPVVEPKITDEVIEDIVRRVIERLGPDAVRDVVVDVVSQISERLVKEEIERIRKHV